MAYQLVSPFNPQRREDSENLIDKIYLVSGYHICYWEFDPISQKYSELNSYDGAFGHAFSDFSWPRKYLSPEGWEIYSSALENLINNHMKLDLKLPLRGENRFMRIVTEYVWSSGIYRGIVKEVTSEVQSDLALRNRNIELSAFEEGLDQFSIVARTDAKGKIIYANEEFCRLSKYSYNELIGKDHRIVNSGFHPTEFFKAMWDCIHEGRCWRGLIKNKAKDGTFYWVDTIVVPIRDEKGELMEILSFRFDVSKLQELREENARLQKEIEALRSKAG